MFNEHPDLNYIDQYTKGVILCKVSTSHHNYLVASRTKTSYQQIPFIVHRRDRGSGEIKQFFTCPNCRESDAFYDPALNTSEKVKRSLNILLSIVVILILAYFFFEPPLFILPLMGVVPAFVIIFVIIDIKGYFIPHSIYFDDRKYGKHKLHKMKTMDEVSLLNDNKKGYTNKKSLSKRFSRKFLSLYHLFIK